jgi:hypothetical protein
MHVCMCVCMHVCDDVCEPSGVRALRQQIRRVCPKWLSVKSIHRRRTKPKKSPVDHLHLGAGRKRARLSVSGCVRPALMKSLTAVGAWRVGVTMESDISRWTATRAESKTAAALRSADHAWYKDREAELRRKSETRIQWGVHAFAGDCTNATVLHNESVRARA